MKKKVLVFVFCCFIVQTYAQIFAPVGSKWVYCYAVNAVGGAEGYDTLVVESVAETHFENLTCRELKVTYCYSWGDYGCGLVSKFNVCQDGKVVYYQEGDSLHLLHDFGAMPDDTLRIRYPIALDTFNREAVDSAFYASPSSPYFDIVVVDTSTLELNGQMVWAQTFAEVGDDDFFHSSWHGGQFLEGIGSTAGWLFPRAINLLQEEHIPMNLVSYTSSTLIGNFFNVNPLCKTTSTKGATLVSSVTVLFRLSPNPAGDILNIETDSMPKGDYQLLIRDSYGRTVEELEIGNTHQINIIHYAPGIYWATLKGTDGSSQMLRFVKSNQ